MNNDQVAQSLIDALNSDADPSEFFEQMNKNHKNQADQYLKKSKKFTIAEIRSFFKRMESIYSELETITYKKAILNLHTKIYVQKMRFRKEYFLLNREYGNFFKYKVWELSSLYSSSVKHFSFTVGAFILFFALLYFGFDKIVQEEFRTIAQNANFVDYVYFSITNMTTLGYGDIIPNHAITKIIAGLEALGGLICIGLFITLLQRK